MKNIMKFKSLQKITDTNKTLDMKIEEIAAKRISQHSNEQGFTPEEVFGQSWNETRFDKEDGWE